MIDLSPSSAVYRRIYGDIASLLESTHRTAAHSINALMTATYWEISHRILESEQGGEEPAGYGQALPNRLVAGYQTVLPYEKLLAGELIARRIGRGSDVEDTE